MRGWDGRKGCAFTGAFVCDGRRRLATCCCRISGGRNRRRRRATTRGSGCGSRANRWALLYGLLALCTIELVVFGRRFVRKNAREKHEERCAAPRKTRQEVARARAAEDSLRSAAPERASETTRPTGLKEHDEDEEDADDDVDDRERENHTRTRKLQRNARQRTPETARVARGPKHTDISRSLHSLSGERFGLGRNDNCRKSRRLERGATD